MPKIVSPLSAPGPSTSGVRRVRPERSACIEEAAHLLAGCFRRLDEAGMGKAPTTSDGGLSPAIGGKFAGSSTTTTDPSRNG